MIIGLSGYAHSGKDTVAGMLMGLHGYERVAFADKIKEFLLEIDPFVMHNGTEFRLEDLIESNGWEVAKVKFPEIRRLLQDLGVGARTLFGDQFWVHEVMKSMLENPKLDLKYVVTDVRFKNEADMIKANHGQIWRINRTGVDAVNDHVSEHDLDDWAFDAVIQNDSDMPNLINQIRTLLG